MTTKGYDFCDRSERLKITTSGIRRCSFLPKFVPKRNDAIGDVEKEKMEKALKKIRCRRELKITLNEKRMITNPLTLKGSVGFVGVVKEDELGFDAEGAYAVKCT